MNSAGKSIEARLMKEAGSNDGRITLAYRIVLGRPPSAKGPELTRALFNLTDFVYAE